MASSENASRGGVGRRHVSELYNKLPSTASCLQTGHVLYLQCTKATRKDIVTSLMPLFNSTKEKDVTNYVRRCTDSVSKLKKLTSLVEFEKYKSICEVYCTIIGTLTDSESAGTSPKVTLSASRSRKSQPPTTSRPPGSHHGNLVQLFITLMQILDVLTFYYHSQQSLKDDVHFSVSFYYHSQQSLKDYVHFSVSRFMRTLLRMSFFSLFNKLYSFFSILM